MSPPKGFVIETAEGRKFEVRGVATKEEAYKVFLQQQGGPELVGSRTLSQEPADAPVETENYVGPDQPVFNRLPNPGQQAFGRVPSPTAQLPRGPVPDSEQFNIQDTRPSAIAAGAITGSAIGAPIAPPLGFLAGGALGAGLGFLGTNLASDVGQATGVIGPGMPIGDSGNPKPLLFDDYGPNINPTLGAIEEMAFDLVVPAAFRTVGRGAVAAGKGIADIGGEHARTIYRYAKEVGVPIGIEALSPRGFIGGGSRRVFGIIPWLGTAFKRSNKDVAGGLFEARERMLHEVAPFLTSMSEQGVQLSTKQLKRGKAAARMFSGKYERLMDRAEAAGAIIPTTETKKVSTAIVKTWRSAMPPKIEKGVKVPIKEFSKNPLVEWAGDNLTKLAKGMSPRQYQRLSIELNKIISEGVAAGDKELVKSAALIKKGLQNDLEQISARRGNFSAEIKDLNKRFGDWQKILKSPPGQKFGRASNTGYDATINQEGKKPADTMFREFFNDHSPKGMAELRQLVGKKQFRSSLRTHMQGAFELSKQMGEGRDAKKTFFNLNVLRQHLGLGKPGSPEYLTLEAALKEADTGVKMSDLNKYFAVAEAHFKLGVIDVSQFVARRAQIGGLQKAMRVLIPGGSVMGTTSQGVAMGSIAGVGLIKAGLFLGAIKGGANLITNPRYLKAITTGLDKNVSKELRNRALTRAARVLMEEAARMDRETVSGGDNAQAFSRFPDGNNQAFPR